MVETKPTPQTTEEEEIPTLSELTAALKGQTAHTEDGKWVAPERNVLRCGVCNAASGVVTLMKIPKEYAEIAKEKGIVGDYVCLGLDCRKQRDVAVNRLVRTVQQQRKERGRK